MERLLEEGHLPDPQEAFVLVCALYVALMPELTPRQRARIRRRAALMLDSKRPAVIRIRRSREDRAVQKARRGAELWWKAILPEMEKLVDLASDEGARRQPAQRRAAAARRALPDT
jgi:hypothetical protein